MGTERSLTTHWTPRSARRYRPPSEATRRACVVFQFSQHHNHHHLPTTTWCTGKVNNCPDMMPCSHHNYTSNSGSGCKQELMHPAVLTFSVLKYHQIFSSFEYLKHLVKKPNSLYDG